MYRKDNQVMISRRGFIKTLAGMAPLLGGAGLCLASPFWERLLLGEKSATLFALDMNSDLVRLAPRARWWTSVPLAGADCRQCHPPGEELRGNGSATRQGSSSASCAPRGASSKPAGGAAAAPG